MELKIKKISDYLLLRSSYMQEIGLFHSKMGVVAEALYITLPNIKTFSRRKLQSN